VSKENSKNSLKHKKKKIRRRSKRRQ